MPGYIHEPPSWPNFSWDGAKLSGRLAPVRHQQGRLIGQMEGLGFSLREEAVLQTLTQDVLKTTQIEGERLDAEQVRSSLARRLGMDADGLKQPDRNVEGVVEMILDATRNYDHQLTAERIFGWHASLFPTGRSGMHEFNVVTWRKGPMQVISGRIGKRTRPLRGSGSRPARRRNCGLPGMV